jgi:hypothetical protein
MDMILSMELHQFNHTCANQLHVIVSFVSMCISSLFVLLISVAFAITPFDPSSCLGKTPFDMAKKFTPGSTVARFINYTMQYQRRDCTQFTGCGPWGPTQPSYGGNGNNGPSGFGMPFSTSSCLSISCYSSLYCSFLMA